MQSIRLLLAALAIALTGPTVAAKDLKRVTLVQAHANVGIGEDVFLYAVPRHLGYFEQEGLDVSMNGVAGSAAAAQVLQSGSAQFATTLPEAIISVRSKGGSLRSVMSLSRGLYWQLALPQGSAIQSFADLKGKTVGVQSLGSGVVPLLGVSFAQAGLQKNDVTLVAVGTGPQAAGAFTSGKVDALALWSPDYARLELSGLKLKYLDLPMNHKGAGLVLASTDTLIQSDAQAVAGFCRAVAKGELFARTNAEAAVRIFYQVFPQARPKGVPEDKAVKDDAFVLRRWLANGSGGDAALPTGQHQPAQWDYSVKQAQEQLQLPRVGPAAEHFDNRFAAQCNAFDKAAIERAAAQWK